jgi:hypothetical protein
MSIPTLRPALFASLQELIAAQAAVRELGPEVLRGLELQYSTQIAALNGQRARHLQSVNASLTAVGRHKSATEAKLQELQARAADASRRVSARAGPPLAPPPLAVSAGVPARSAALPPSVAPVASSAPAPAAFAPPALGVGGYSAIRHAPYSVAARAASPAAVPYPQAATSTPQYFGHGLPGGSARMSLSTGGEAAATESLLRSSSAATGTAASEGAIARALIM